MTGLESKLAPFARRVRLLFVLRGLFFGLLAGGLAAAGWAVLDWTRVLYADWRSLAVVVGVCALAGSVLGALKKTSVQALASSVDRRAGLKDRLGTATERLGGASPFDPLLLSDAEAATGRVSPKVVFPVRMGWLQVVAVASLACAAGVFLLGNSPFVRGPKSTSEREELKRMGEAVQRVAKPLEKQVNANPVPEGKKALAQDLNKFARELTESKLNKEEALRKANEMAKKAEEQAKDSGQEAVKATEQAETALSKYTKMQLDEKGVTAEDLERMKLSAEQQEALEKAIQDSGFKTPESKFSDKQLSEMGVSKSMADLAQMTPEQRAQLRESIAKQQEEIQKQIDKMDQMPESERRQMQAQMDELRRQQQEMQKLADAMKLSEEAMQSLREFMQSPEFQELQKMMQEMKQKSEQAAQGGKAPTKEEIEQMRQRMEELAKALKDPELRKQMIEQMKEALKQMEQGGDTQQAMQQMMTAMGMAGLDPGGDGGRSQDNFFADTGKVNKSEHEEEGKGNTQATKVQGAWGEKGDQWSVTVKAPTQVGNKSSVPYQSVMPQYKKAAEKALSGGKIPKGKEARVKEYFESLSGGKSK